jgi:hypothetical protein
MDVTARHRYEGVLARATSNSFRRDCLLALVIFFAAAAEFASFRPWNRPVLLDAATWDYMAVETARGLVPYRDVFLHKTPGAALLGGTAAWIGSHAGVEPVVAAHALFLFFGSLAPALLFLLVRPQLPVGAAVAAALGLLAFDEWVIAALEGCRPKVATVTLGLASMLAAERGAARTASLLGGCSVLCWQPGVAFLAGAWAAAFRRGERRVSQFAVLALLAVLPSVAVLTWLAAHGALGDFFDQAVLFNLHYIDAKARTPLGTLRGLRRTIGEWNDIEMLLLPAALCGMWLRSRILSAGEGESAAAAADVAMDSRSPAVPRLPLSLAVASGIYGVMVFVSYQSWPDAILLGPIVATVLAAGLYALMRTRLSATASSAIVILLVALAVLPDDKPKFHPPIDFAKQHERYVALGAGLAPDARIVAVSVPEFLLHTGRRNGWKWPYMWFGVDDFASDHTGGGFDGILADLERNPPAMMLVGRLWVGPQRAHFERWAAERYDVRSMRLFPHLKRPLRVYRLRT